ncbi:class I SAM-dependent methyltransferase [Microlunatus parietis]|uniref:2-polyprenyl-3-methyl-5-hydroxy-6-metoxy-1, 4-benzoquinol methylase n=1 Tax=Microlunatus parietis TaxID=682979 RepID=A0A7Y9IAH0_9ACTN|nr:class I SAM-dependent methyltransferase [Microlunatus parietis]NYE73090.1 2-polyprenyl-3-methyl-5-hydroxy-6-metoxy-1,4-benzoquinol methylase [Microlunatus parietis]
MPSNLAYHGSLGDHFNANAANSAYNAHIDRPAMLELAGDVTGQRILDAGCGAGFYAAALADRGASVLGLEDSTALVEHARTRVGDRAKIRQHDLNTPLDGLADGSFDGVLCALVLHHLADRPRFLGEVFRVLRPGGWLVLSTTHPTADWQHFEDSYFSADWVDLAVRGTPHSVRFQRMNLEVLLGELLGAGFVLERLVEPRPVEALRDLDADRYAQLVHRPTLLAVRLRRP